MKKSIDKISGYGLPFMHLLNTGIYGNRTRQNCGIFTSSILKGVLGWTGNIQNTCRSLICAVFNIPALYVLNSFEQEHITMSHDHASSLLLDSSRDLSFVSSLLEKAPLLANEHPWAVRVIMNTAIQRAEAALKIVEGVKA